MLRIIIKTDNEAFQGETGSAEVARILRQIAQDFDGGCYESMLPRSEGIMDGNGNTVGEVVIR